MFEQLQICWKDGGLSSSSPRSPVAVDSVWWQLSDQSRDNRSLLGDRDAPCCVC